MKSSHAQWLKRLPALFEIPAPDPPRLLRRIVMMERDDRIRTIEAHGVEMLRWAEDDTTLSRQARLQLLSRRARDARGRRGRW